MKPFDAITAAKTFATLVNPGEEADQAFKRWAKIVHPDKWEDLMKPVAEAAFQRLNELFQEYTKPAIIQVGKYTIGAAIAYGDIANLYKTSDGDIFKIVRSRADNDLMEREARALKDLRLASPHFAHYLPTWKDSFLASGRAVNVMDCAESFRPLAAIPPFGFRHVVWMINRVLSVLGMIHQAGYVHGAILPQHLLYDGVTHDLRLVDWCYCSKTGEKVPAIIPDCKYLYPQEVLRKKPAGPATDIYMALRVFEGRAQVPKEFQVLFDWGRAESIQSRPQSAWLFQDKWQATARQVYGPPKFVALSVNEA